MIWYKPVMGRDANYHCIFVKNPISTGYEVRKMNVLVRRRTNKAARLATVVLLLIAFVSNSMMYAYAAGGDAFSFTIDETTFTVTPGSDPFVTSTTEGAVEIATANGAMI